MDFKKIQDFTTKTWYVDYKDEDGFDVYGPDTHEGCTKFIQNNNARTSAGEKFDVERGPYQKVQDSVEHKSTVEDLADALYDMMAIGVESGSMNILINGDPCEVHFEDDDFTSISLTTPNFTAGASGEDWSEDQGEWDPEALLDKGVDDIKDAVRNHYGEEFTLEILPEEDEIYDSKISDGYKEEQAAEYAIDADKVLDLYELGEVKINIPSDVAPHEFAQACISFINELWGEPEVNFPYEEVNFNYAINDDEDEINIFVEE